MHAARRPNAPYRNMSDLPQPTPPPEKKKAWTVFWLRATGSAVLLLLVAVGAIDMFGRTERASRIEYQLLADLGQFFLYLAAGLVCGGLLVGMSALLRVLRDLHFAFSRIERYQYEQTESHYTFHDTPTLSAQGTAGADDGGNGAAPEKIPWRDLLAVLEDLRDTSLLSEEERANKRQRVANEEFEQAGARIRERTAQGEFAAARDLVEQIIRKYPDDERGADLRKQVEMARERHESEDVASCKRQIADLVNISAWGRAREMAEQLRIRHPDSVEARQLLISLEKDHLRFQDEQRRRMYTEVQRFVTRRRWEEALAAAQTFLQRFPSGEESDALRMQLPTLQGNAEIEVRQRLESRIMEYARQKRYFEAVDLARKVIRDFPQSPQAQVLRGQLDRLEELAENPDAAPARLRDE